MYGYLDTGLYDPTGSYIVPPYGQDSPTPSRQPTSAPSYETPWYVDSINRAIERAAQVATIAEAGYPQYPQFPSPSPQPVPMPAPGVAPGVAPQQQGIHLSQGTLMLVVGGVLLFMLGKRGR